MWFPALFQLYRSSGESRFLLLTRNNFAGPEMWNLDMRFSMRFYLKQKMNVEFFVEAFNIFNRTQVTGLNTEIYNLNSATNTLTCNSLFGTVAKAGCTLHRERKTQLVVRFQFQAAFTN